ncbi:Two-component response regulator-like PRR73 [Acorus calamus]|uniref:Two-component response regulator-like PRR73 n=1 Tax=Acorus calamus TaxID=4465 RepID=A0AAV9F3Q6_ACOCL|nr:Two-component response regulator-like PRR73 [Acorus calamus]
MGSIQPHTNNTTLNNSSIIDAGKSQGCDVIVANGMVGESGNTGLSEEESKNNGGTKENVRDASGAIIGVLQTVSYNSKQQQGSVVSWERFLPLRSLKVLLVENDDSTRHVVSALLRNCSYEVLAAENGLQAWKILEDFTNHVDLVLTEVLMPCLSGVGLLCKIMSHKTFRNIPVIMMSSHDSMGLVFKCLTKGAVDFLVKPIRKNELKNLWQHVWRRCHSSSGSGSESGIQIRKSPKSKSADESDNNSGSNDDDDDESIGLNVRDGSDNGSGTQSSWTKRAVEVDSPQTLSAWEQFDDPPDSTCALVIHPKHEILCNERVPKTADGECQKPRENLDYPMGKDLEIGVPSNLYVPVSSDTNEKSPFNAEDVNDIVPERDINKKNQSSKEKLLKFNCKKLIGDLNDEAVDPSGGTSTNVRNRMPRDNEASIVLTKVFETENNSVSDAKELPSLELSLKRLRSFGESATDALDDRNVLKRSDLSAFSRYNTATAATQTPMGNVGKCSLPRDVGSDAMKAEPIYNKMSSTNTSLLNQPTIGTSKNLDICSTNMNGCTKTAAPIDKISSPKAKHINSCSAFQPVQHWSSPAQKVSKEKPDEVTVSVMLGHSKEAPQQVQVQHHHHHYHHHHHHVHNVQQQQLKPATDQDDVSMNNVTSAAPHGSSNIFSAMEGNAGNYSINGSVSGSNHMSNDQNGSCTAINAGLMNTESDNGVIANNVASANNISASGSGTEQDRVAQREAALNKFRLKRKERCFEKKVRYQSRKRLAEQRPRVRGQFVRQNVYDQESHDGDG